MKFVFIAAVLMVLSFSAKAQVAGQAVKTLFKVAKPALSAVEKAETEGLALKVWQRNSVIVGAEKSGENYQSMLFRVEKVNSTSPRYEEALMESLKDLGEYAPKGARISVEGVTDEGAKVFRVIFPRNINKATGDAIIEHIEKNLSAGQVGYHTPASTGNSSLSFIRNLKNLDDHLKNAGAR